MYPTIDLHCDLLSYLLNVSGADPFSRADIGCSIPDLQRGNVKLQVMAIYAPTQPDSVEKGLKQSEIFRKIVDTHTDHFQAVESSSDFDQFSKSEKIGIVAAIENGSVFCAEGDSLDSGFEQLEKIISNAHRILCIGLTHHTENRFGGGNNSTLGLKNDGEELLKYISGRQIAIDFSHTSDALAHDILNCINKFGLDVPVMASHSNYRSIYVHNRNLPDEIAQEIINRKGVIGLNLLRAFLDNENPQTLYDHIAHGLSLGGKESICFGADYFYTFSHPDPSRIPFYHKNHENAGCYPQLLLDIEERFSKELAESISHQNVVRFVQRLWN